MVFSFLVVKALSVPVILGMDFQKEYVKAIYPGTDAVLWYDGSLTSAVRAWTGKEQAAPQQRAPSLRLDPAALSLSRSVTVEPYSVQAVFGHCGTTGRCLLRERPAKMAEKGILLHNALADVKARRDFRFYLTNITARPVNLPKGFVVGLVEPYHGPVFEADDGTCSPLGEGADTVAEVTQGPEADGGGSHGPILNPEQAPDAPPPPDESAAQRQDGPKLPRVAYELIPPELHEAVRDLVGRYQGLWDGTLGRMDITPHRITLAPGSRPVRSQPYRTGLYHRGLIADQVAKQLKLGVIEPSQAEWSFPVVIVPKPDGSPRFCVDYRRLNDMTVKDTYPLPRMDDCIDFLGEATVFSVLDCNMGYWQIPVAVEDQDKTTFTCHEGTYRYVRLPFGLTNAPATFQRAIDMLLAGLKWKSVLVYLDDVIVFSRSAQEHVGHLEEVFSLIAKAGISLKASKCFLFQEEVEYLGHIVGKGHVRVNEKNLVGLRKAEPPTTKKSLRSFLGMCNVYRRFVKDYAAVARPLTALTSSKVADPLPKFNEEQVKAFEDLKWRLTHTPILALPRRTGQYTVDTDASAAQVGCVLLQEQPGGGHKPVGYWSRPLSSAERNYSTTERECLAVVWALFLLRPYLLGTRFIVRTDHTALKWMLHMDGAHGRLAQWRLRLAEFDYLVETRSGAAHHAADTMSRLTTSGADLSPIPEEIPCLTLANFARGWVAPDPKTNKGYPPLTLERLVKAQSTDIRCQSVRAEMDKNAHSRFGETPDGLLVRLSPLDKSVQVYVPEGLRQEVLTLEHMPAHAGHPGVNKMYASMRRTYYWEAMAADVYDYVANCDVCAKSKVRGRRRTAPLRLFPASEALADVCLDLLGPLPTTASGNRFLLVIVDRFSKLTRVAPIPRENAETVASAFCDTWVASYGPPDTLLTDNGPQLASTFFRGFCGMLGIRHLTSTAYHPQTQGQVERYNRTIVAQLKAYVSEHQESWDELVSVLSLAYNSRPQQSTGVAPLEFAAPERVRNLSLERLPASPYPKEVPQSPRAAREYYRARLRNLTHQVRKALASTQRRYKRAYDKRVRPVNKTLRVGDWAYVDANIQHPKKLDETVLGPFQIVGRDAHTFTVMMGGHPERVSGDNVARAPTPKDQVDSSTILRGPQGLAVPWDHTETGQQFVWERFVDYTHDEEGKLWLLVRWWGYAADEDTWEPHDRLDERKVAEYCRRMGVAVPPTAGEIRALWGPLYELCHPGEELDVAADPSDPMSLVEALTIDPGFSWA